MPTPPVIAVTMGDPAGVGAEICLKACRLPGGGNHSLVVFGDAKALSRLSVEANLAMPCVAEALEEAVALSRVHGAAVWHIEALGNCWLPGIVSSTTGHASYRYITAAIEAALSGQVDAIVTGPIHKEALRLSGVQYPGHTEIFEALTKSPRACMMLTSDALTCSFVTTHVGLCEVPGCSRPSEFSMSLN